MITLWAQGWRTVSCKTGQLKRINLGTVKLDNGFVKWFNSFADNHPGKGWWYAFLAHSNHTVRSYSSLKMYQALAEFKYVVHGVWEVHSLFDKPDRTLNCDESGFLFCPKSGTSRNKDSVFHLLCTKRTITTLVAICASRCTIPPMHIFPGKCLLYNPMCSWTGQEQDTQPYKLFRTTMVIEKLLEHTDENCTCLITTWKSISLGVYF